MIYAGIDAGILNTKVVITDGGKILGKAVGSTGGMDRPEQITEVYQTALKNAGVTEQQIEKVVATGKAKFDVPFPHKVYTETVSTARAAQFFFPEATGAMSVGADEALALKLGEKRLVDEFVLNQKCSAGIGTFLHYLGQRLGMTEEQISAADDPGPCKLNEGCMVFSELDAISLLNDGASREQVMAAAIRAAASRAATVLVDLTADPGERVVLIGGLAKNRAFVQALEDSLGRKFLIPSEPEFSGALGAVLCWTKGI